MGTGIFASNVATLTKGSFVTSNGAEFNASTIDVTSGSRIRKYRRSEASPVSGTTRGLPAARPLRSR